MPIFPRKSLPKGEAIQSISVNAIIPNPNQPRRHFSPEELEELAQSIHEVGVIQPLTVRKVAEGWELIAGERRLRASVMAGLEAVPCLVVDVDESRSTLLALIENVQRQDLDFWEEALAMEKLIEVCGLSQGEAARKLGKSQSAVANKLRLLKLPADVLIALRDGGCAERQARALLRLPGETEQREAARYIIEQQMNVAQTEEYVDSLLAPKEPVKSSEKQKSCRPIYRTPDVRLFMNTLTRGLSMMNAAGIKAKCGKEETEHEILLTIRISK